MYKHLPIKFILAKKQRTLLTVWAALIFCVNAFAQQTISGRVVSSEDSSPVPGVSVVVKGSAKGTLSDADGNYRISIPDDKAVLIFSFVGYITQEVMVGNQSVVNISLQNDAKELSEVVVTALGLEREKRDLGYSVQEISGDAMTKARETNIGNALAGKVAGVTVVGNPAGVGASSRITIRGERSLNINGNQPLFVVDGVPITNEVFGSSGRNNQEVDYGNGAGLVNPDDVESLTVLKGPAATALYGARGQNGVIIIKTKSGKGTRGEVAFNSTVTFETPLRLPDYQNVYGQGLNGEFEFKDGNGGGVRDGVDESWGPKMDGQLIRSFDSPTSNGLRGGDVGNLNTQIGPVDLAAQLALRGEITPTPFVARPDNIKDFFDTGVTYTQNVSVSGSNDHGYVRASYTYLDQKGMVPNTDLKRHTFSLSSGYNLTQRLSFQATANYVKNLSDNRPNLSYGTENIMYLLNCWFPRNINIASLRNYWQEGREGLNQFNFNYNYHDNPYFNLYENTNGQEIDRLFGNVSATYKFTDWLKIMARVGTDYSDEFRDRRRAYSTQRYPLGSYREEQIFLQETNADVLLSAHKEISSDVSLQVSLGANAMRRRYNLSDISAPQLTVPGIYSLNNSRVALTYYSYKFERRINSMYAFGQVGFRNYLFLELTARNDWSSTLPSDNWSYFYPSASLSLVLSDVVNLQSTPINFAKLRVGYAGVGNDTDAYQLYSTFSAQIPVQGLPAYSESATIANANLKPEQSRSLETGLDVRFFDNRIGLDVTYYRNLSENQIIRVPLSNTTGFSSRVINAGLIENKGVEIMLNLVPVKSNSFEWNVDVNFSQNRSRVKELYKDPESGQEIKNYVIADSYVTVEARVGERMGDMYGIGYQRVSQDPASPYYDPTGQYVGQIVYNSEGKPLPTADKIKLGNYNPDWLAGIYSTFNYRGLTFGFLFDIRHGGKVYSHTQTVGREGGIIKETLEGRANGYDLSLPGNGVTGEGVVPVTDGEGNITGYTPNTTELSAREWHTSITLGRRIIEGMVYDASFVKLREVKFGYTLPSSLTGNLPLKNINISFVARNLFLLTDVPHIDPETASINGGTIVPGVESVAIPSSRSYGFNLSFKL
ncbi:SusC/RagA family TonB-linked outer membrane protein [Chryseosolibacter indicus]|uniref:SusC/RagA family TonB-linked outer membrane protein n=1 Tax=Chryseosolibacter indicus TaxID=2782351 RepID=A0ABS5VUW7_9BACT|nr:SusC/RagA family TonB-linked outer membrane protein [Chryseosolibacter indicus]MBT1704615.1 SusC/RagA family TonB-linked outer membrane protein [Chryseosolibacter indicus]